MSEEELFELLYEQLCQSCPNAKKCHDECENCDEFNERLMKYDN